MLVQELIGNLLVRASLMSRGRRCRCYPSLYFLAWQLPQKGKILNGHLSLQEIHPFTWVCEMYVRACERVLALLLPTLQCTSRAEKGKQRRAGQHLSLAWRHSHFLQSQITFSEKCGEFVCWNSAPELCLRSWTQRDWFSSRPLLHCWEVTLLQPEVLHGVERKSE